LEKARMEMTAPGFREKELNHLEAVFMHKDKEETLRFFAGGDKT